MFQDTSASMGTSSVTFTTSTRTSSILCYTCTYKTFIVISANRQIGKDQKYQNNCRCPPVQPSKEKGSQEYQVTSEATENSNASSSAKVTDPYRIIPLFSRSSDTASTVSPQPQEEPQPEGTSADVHEQTTEPMGSIIASVVSSIQTSTAPPQGNVLSMKLLPMNLSFHLIITPFNFQLTSFHR